MPVPGRKMKGHFWRATAKGAGFLVCWVAVIAVFSSVSCLDRPGFLGNQAAFWRLWWEFLPLLGTLLLTFLFLRLVERNRLDVPLWAGFGPNALYGVVLGTVWFAGPLLIAYSFGVYQIGAGEAVPFFSIWLLACFLNVVMQEYLVRGYLFALFQSAFSAGIATAVTTVLFTLLHGGAFSVGPIAVLNVATMGIFVSLLRLETGTLLAPIAVHFIWNAAGGLVFGIIPLAEDYPSILQGSFEGSPLWSGGEAGLEGSAIVLIVNLLLIAFVSRRIRRRKSA